MVKYSVDSIKRTVHLACHGLIYGIFNRDFLKITVENSTLNRDSTFNRTVCLIESTE